MKNELHIILYKLNILEEAFNKKFKRDEIISKQIELLKVEASLNSNKYNNYNRYSRKYYTGYTSCINE